MKAGPNTTPNWLNGGGAGIDWTVPDYAHMSDNRRARANLTDTPPIFSKYLVGQDWGFAIPSGAIIRGIEAKVERRATLLSLGTEIRDGITNGVRLQKFAVGVGENKKKDIAWPGTDTVETYGGPTDLWGLTWTPEEINAHTFGFILFAQLILGYQSSPEVGSAQIDQITLSVYYDPPPPEPSPLAPGRKPASWEESRFEKVAYPFRVGRLILDAPIRERLSTVDRSSPVIASSRPPLIFTLPKGAGA